MVPAGTEFENVVPRSRYIEAAASLLDDESGKISEAAFSAWESRFTFKPTMMFSKRVERWLDGGIGESIPKPRLMEKVVELTIASEISSEPFRRLVEAVEAVSQSL
jgi:hypothetical protein